jgi:hypothetical protein
VQAGLELVVAARNGAYFLIFSHGGFPWARDSGCRKFDSD